MRESIVVVEPREIGDRVARAVDELAGRALALAADHLVDTLALLAAGRIDRVQPLLRAPSPDPALPLLLGRYVDWTGDLHTAAAAWQAARQAVAAQAAALEQGADPLLLVLATAGAAALERTATDLGDPQLAASLRARARAAAARLQERALDGKARRLARLLGVDGPDGGGTAGHGGPAHAVLEVCVDLLGLQPDAARLRLRLRPRLPTGAAALDVRNIAFADAAVSLRCERQPGRLLCSIEQDRGALPVTALLEPVLPAACVGAEVDGRTAELRPQPHGSGWLVPVQLVLDARRSLVVHTDEGPPT